jgi:hypothetical protein
VEIGEQEVSLGCDPEDEEVNKDINLRTLQELEFIPLSECSRFSLIDVVYFKILLEECNNRSYFAEWYREVKRLVKDYTM